MQEVQEAQEVQEGGRVRRAPKGMCSRILRRIARLPLLVVGEPTTIDRRGAGGSQYTGNPPHQ